VDARTGALGVRMKKKVLIVLIFMVINSVFAKNYKSIGFVYDYEDSLAFIYYNNEEAYFILPYVGEYAKLDKSVFYVDKDGYLKFNYRDKKLVILDSDVPCFVFDFSSFQTDGKINYPKKDNFGFPLAAAKNLKNISASSFLTEKSAGIEIKYSPENLCKVIFYLDHEYSWNREHLPWVEGVSGNGIGETITLEYKEPVIGISVLSGYVELQKLKLFKENSRLKKIEIENLETGKKQIADFEDRVYFKYIQLEEPAEKIKITIKDVYPGTKYSDTCISAIHGHWYLDKDYSEEYFETNKPEWHLESQETVLDDCFSGMNLWKNKYKSDELEDNGR